MAKTPKQPPNSAKPDEPTKPKVEKAKAKKSKAPARVAKPKSAAEAKKSTPKPKVEKAKAKKSKAPVRKAKPKPATEAKESDPKPQGGPILNVTLSIEIAGTAVVPEAVGSRGLFATAVAPNWVCPAAGTPDLEDRILTFLETEAIARVNADPRLHIFNVWFTLQEIVDGMDHHDDPDDVRLVLNQTLRPRGCVAVDQTLDPERYQARER